MTEILQSRRNFRGNKRRTVGRVWAGVEFLRSAEIAADKIGLLGHSEGGLIAIFGGAEKHCVLGNENHIRQYLDGNLP